jgi:hypothetical protein
MKLDMDEQALTDAEGYEFKKMQVESELSADDLAGVPMNFFNVESDDPAGTRKDIFTQLERMRKAVAEQLFDLCAAAQEIIENHEQHELNAAIEEVAKRLNDFLKGNRSLGARERLAYAEAISMVKGVRYASTLWASVRRSGEYSGLNIVHLIGIGAARDARLRSEVWFKSLDAFLNSLKIDGDLAPAMRTIDQISGSAATSKAAFLEGAQRAGVEVYREPLTQAPVWPACASEWGRGPGFKIRVAEQLEGWFESNPDLKETLENIIGSLWEQSVISPLRRLVEESAPEGEAAASNVVRFPSQLSA